MPSGDGNYSMKITQTFSPNHPQRALISRVGLILHNLNNNSEYTILYQSTHLWTSRSIVCDCCGVDDDFCLHLFIWIFTKIKRTESQAVVSSAPGISIIIASRNALPLLEKNLPNWLAQDYPNFEVIIANDRSTDDTPLFLIEQKTCIPNSKSFRSMQIS